MRCGLRKSDRAPAGGFLPGAACLGPSEQFGAKTNPPRGALSTGFQYKNILTTDFQAVGFRVGNPCHKV
jgi:hypothetical protein